MNLNNLALRVAALKALDSQVKRALVDAKEQFLDAHGRGTQYASIDGSEVAQVTVARGKEAKLVVADEAAFLAWCREHRPTSIMETVRASDRAAILETAQRTGELPDGVDLGEPGRPYVMVRQSPEQEKAIAAAWSNGTLPVGEIMGVAAREVEA